MFSPTIPLEKDYPAAAEEPDQPENSQLEFSDLSSLLLSMGNDPSINLVSILEFGPKFLNCDRVNYLEHSQESVLPTNEEKTVVLPLAGCDKCLVLFGVEGEPHSENLKIFIALLTQQEKRLRDQLKMKSFKQYSKILFENCPDGIVVTDGSGYIINTNRAMVAMARKPMNALIGLRVNQLATDDGRKTAFQALRKLRQQPKSRFDCRMKVGAGRTIPISICFSDFVFQDQNLIIATVRDLSYLEEKAKKSVSYEESLANSIENATDGFVRYDQFGRICEVNPHIEKLTGVFSGRLVGRPIDDLLSNDSLRSFRAAVSRLNQTGYASFHCKVRHSSGVEISSYGTLMQFEHEGERYCRLMLQERKEESSGSTATEPTLPKSS